MKAAERVKWLGLACLAGNGYLCCQCRYFELHSHYDYEYGTEEYDWWCDHPLTTDIDGCLVDDDRSFTDCWKFRGKTPWKIAAKNCLTAQEAEELYWSTVSRMDGFWCGPELQGKEVQA